MFGRKLLKSYTWCMLSIRASLWISLRREFEVRCFTSYSAKPANRLSCQILWIHPNLGNLFSCLIIYFCEWCIFMYVHACSCVYMRTCQVEVRGQHRSSALPVHLILFFVVFGFQWYFKWFYCYYCFWLLHVLQACWSIRCWGSFLCLLACCRSPGITDMCCHVWPYVGSRGENLVLVLIQWTFYLLSHLIIPF